MKLTRKYKQTVGTVSSSDYNLSIYPEKKSRTLVRKETCSPMLIVTIYNVQGMDATYIFINK